MSAPKSSDSARKPEKVVVASPSPYCRAGLKQLLGKIEGIRVVGVAGDGETAVSLVRETRAGAAILASDLPRLSGLDAAVRIAQESPTTRVMLLVDAPDPAVIEGALRAKVSAILLKSCSPRVVARAVTRSRPERPFT